MKSIVIQKSANREVRVGWQDLPHPKKQHGDTESAKAAARYAESAAIAETEVVRVGDRAYLIDNVNGCSILASNEADCHEALQRRALDIIGDFQRKRKVGKNDYKSGWGYDPKVTQFGSYARHTILEAGAIASRGSRHAERGIEVTLTIPGGTDSAFRAVSQWSGWAINRLLQVIRREGIGAEYFYVWEVQKRGALHIHMALSGAGNAELLRLGRKVRKCWYRVLEEIGRKSSTDPFARGKGYGRNTYREFLKGNRVAEIKSSLAAYFAKYVSKGKTKSAGQGGSKIYPPSRWWGISRSLLSKVKKERLNVRFTCLSENQCVELLSIVQSFIRRHSPIRCTGYSFEVSYGNEGRSRAVGIGARWLYWFADESFSSIEVWLPQLLRYLRQYCSNAVIQGDIGWMCDQKESPWESRRLTAEAVG